MRLLNADDDAAADDGAVPVEEFDTATLQVGDHTVEVSCDGEAVARTVVRVVEVTRSSVGGPSVLSALLLFLCLGAGVVAVAPSATAAAPVDPDGDGQE